MMRIIPRVALTAAQGYTKSRALSTVGTTWTASQASQLSGYNKIDFCIDEQASVLDAVKRFVGNNIGCLATRNTRGELTGIISERDYITKVDLLGKNPENTPIKDVRTPGSKLVTASPDETVQVCMEKMLAADVRHLPVIDHGDLVGMISIKDLVRTCVKEQEQTIKVLSDFAFGKSVRY